MKMISNTLEKIERTVRSQLLAHDGKRWVIGYSGGLDSTVLLSLCQRLYVERSATHSQQIVAVHVNHQLSPNAAAWQSHCQRFCEALGVEFVAAKVDVHPAGGGIEQAARKARMDFFASFCQADDLLVLAHHQNDQIETLLLRLLRGSGPTGLAAMAPISRIGNLKILRPLLDVGRDQLEVIADELGLQWVDDESNQKDVYDRNFLRLNVIPLLKQRWPNLEQALSRSARLCGETSAVLEAFSLSQCEEHLDEQGGLDIAWLSGQGQSLQRQLLRAWLVSRGLPFPSERNLLRIQNEIMPAKEDAVPEVMWSGWVVGRFRGRLYAFPRLVAPEGGREVEITPDQWQRLLAGSGEDILDLGEGWGRLRARVSSGAGLRVDSLGEVVQVRVRRGGERCRPVARPQKLLKKWLQDYQLPPWLRDHQPLIYQNDRLIAVPGLFVCQGFQAQPGEKGLSLQWEPPSKPIKVC